MLFFCAGVSSSTADLRPEVGHSAASLRVPEELAQGQLVPSRSDAGRDWSRVRHRAGRLVRLHLGHLRLRHDRVQLQGRPLIPRGARVHDA